MTDNSILKNAGNQVFTFPRFYKYLLYYVKSNKRPMLLVLGSLFVCLSVLFILLGSDTDYSASYYAHLKGDPMWSTEVQMTVMAFFVAMTIFGNQMYMQMSNRRTRLNTIETPASNLEKGATFFLIWGIAMPILFFVCVWLADIVRVIYLSIMQPDADKIAVINISDLFTLGIRFMREEGTTASCKGVVLSYGMGYFIEGFFALCGLIFSKNTYMKTAITGFLLFWLLFFLGFLGTYMFYGMHFHANMAFQEFMSGPNIIIVAAILLLDVLLFWLSFARFCEAEIIFRW